MTLTVSSSKQELQQMYTTIMIFSNLVRFYTSRSAKAVSNVTLGILFVFIKTKTNEDLMGTKTTKLMKTKTNRLKAKNERRILHLNFN